MYFYIKKNTIRRCRSMQFSCTNTDKMLCRDLATVYNPTYQIQLPPWMSGDLASNSDKGYVVRRHIMPPWDIAFICNVNTYTCNPYESFIQKIHLSLSLPIDRHNWAVFISWNNRWSVSKKQTRASEPHETSCSDQPSLIYRALLVIHYNPFSRMEVLWGDQHVCVAQMNINFQ